MGVSFRETVPLMWLITREEAAKLLGEGSISQYMEKVIQRIEDEIFR